MSKINKNKVIRVLLIISGHVLFVLGTAGIFLPVLPTVPFYLLSVCCFARGSAKYERWLRNTKLFKKRVYFFDKNKVMTLKSMLSMLLFVSAILAVTCLFVDTVAVSVTLPLVSAFKYLYFICKVKPISKADLERLKALDREASV